MSGSNFSSTAFAAGLLLLTSCGQAMTESERLQKVSDLARAGSGVEAITLANAYVERPIGHLDPSDPSFCTLMGVKTQVENHTQNISRSVASTAGKGVAESYATITSSVDEELGHQAETILAVCPSSQAELVEEAISQSRSVMQVIDGILNGLKSKAAAEAIPDLEATSAKVREAVQQARGQQFIDRCRRLRDVPNAVDPVAKMAEDMERRTCATMGR